MWEQIGDSLSQLATNSGTASRAIELAATISIVKSSAGFLHTINVGMHSNPTITFFDNASGASGTILAHIEPQGIGRGGSFLVDVSVLSGITAYTTAGNAPRITVSYR